MKPSIVILTVSLLANAALAVLYWQQSSGVRSSSELQKTSAAPAARVAVVEDDVAAALRAHPDFAEAIRSGDPHRLRDALIRAGFPDDYVRDMVTFHTGNSVTPERLALLRMQAEKPFWQTSLSEEGLALERMLRDRDAKNNALAREVFGGKLPPHPLEALNQQRRYRFLPAEKVEAVVRIDSDYAELAAENRGSAMTPEGRERARLLQQEKRNDLVKILTPQELELYDLNISTTAEMMRRQLVLFQPTEDEFRALFQIRRAHDEKYGLTLGGPMDPSLMQQRAADMQAVNNQARALLGDQRYAEYQRAQDQGYRAAVEIVRHFNLPASHAVDTYTLQQSITQQAQEINRTAGADRSAAAAQISTLVKEAKMQLTRLLGTAGADAYSNSGGAWLNMLERAATNPAGNAPPRG